MELFLIIVQIIQLRSANNTAVTIDSQLIGTLTPSERLSFLEFQLPSISKGSGSFKIPHPLESKRDTHNLVHSFLESPQANLIYRGRVDLVDGVASVNIDTASDMTDGTFVLLCRDVQSFTTNESGWTAVRSSVEGNILTIEAQDNTCTDSISWMVVGERQDEHMYETEWTDENGKVIVEPLIPPPPPPPEPELEEESEPEENSPRNNIMAYFGEEMDVGPYDEDEFFLA